jgi:FkbM family methyltransferase
MTMISPLQWWYSWNESAKKRAGEARHIEAMKDFYRLFVGPGELCFDVGANLGNRTAILSDIGCQVVSIEPQPLCLKRLRKLFGKSKNVIIVDAAVGQCEGMGELAICEDEPTISTMSEKWMTEGRFAGNNQWTKKIEVRITTLDSLIAQYGTPKFCKIDVEGFELAVIKGLSSPVSYLSFEFTREFFADAKSCIDHLLTIGPAVFNVSLGESMELMAKQWMSAETLYERIEAEEDVFLWGDIYAQFR